MTAKDEEMLAYFESQRLDRLQDYMQRGRPLADLTDDHLNQRWVAEFRHWMKNFGTRVDHRTREDIEAELQLRGHEPPFALVPEEFEAMQAASRAQTDRLLRDPYRTARKERQLTEELEQFRKGSAGKRTN